MRPTGCHLTACECHLPEFMSINLGFQLFCTVHCDHRISRKPSGQGGFVLHVTWGSSQVGPPGPLYTMLIGRRVAQALNLHGLGPDPEEQQGQRNGASCIAREVRKRAWWQLVIQGMWPFSS